MTEGKPIGGYGQERTTLRGYNGKLIQQYGVRVIVSYLNNQYWNILFHMVNAQGLILLGLNTLKKMGLFTKHPRVSIETVDLYSSAQTLPGVMHKWKRLYQIKCNRTFDRSSVL